LITKSNERSQLLEQLENKEFRDALVEADITNGILFQLHAMLEERGWKQEDLAVRAGTSQPVISKYMQGYANYSVKTLKKLASALDVSLTVSFERFSDLANRNLTLEETDLKIPSFSEDAALYAPVTAYSLASTVAVPESFATGSFHAQSTVMVPAGQFDLDMVCVALGSHEATLFEAKAPRQKEEKKYALAA